MVEARSSNPLGSLLKDAGLQAENGIMMANVGYVGLFAYIGLCS
jgi:hypothetical protein